MTTFDDTPNSIPDCEMEIERIKLENYKIKLKIAQILDSGREPRNLQAIFDENEAKISFLQEKIKLMTEKCRQRLLELTEKRRKEEEQRKLNKRNMFAFVCLGSMAAIILTVIALAIAFG